MIALYSAYTQIWSVVDDIIKEQTKKLKIYILLIANFNINKLSRISENVVAATLSHNNFSFNMIKKIGSPINVMLSFAGYNDR